MIVHYSNNVAVSVLTIVILCSLSQSSLADNKLNSRIDIDEKATTSSPDINIDDRYLFNLPEPSASQIIKEIPVAASRFYVKIVAADSSKDSIPYRDISGSPISDKILPRNWCLGAIEGSISTTFNGKPVILNYVQTKNNPKFNVDCLKEVPIGSSEHDGKSRYKLTNAKFGLGVKNWFLVPYRTIAVDPSYIRYGTVIYIAKARGKLITLPSGEKIHHDGYFFAGDRGNSEKIKHERIDIFCAFDEKCLSDVTKSNDKIKYPMAAKVINNDKIEAMFLRFHEKE